MLNAANEVAVDAFLEGRFRFPAIPEVIERAMRDRNGTTTTLDAIGPPTPWARELSRNHPGAYHRRRNFRLSTSSAFLFVLGVLVFVHELGHFLVARWYGVRVLTFSLGFGPKLRRSRRGDTEYCLAPSRSAAT